MLYERITRKRNKKVPEGPRFIGWSQDHFDNLRFRISLETKEITTCAAASRGSAPGGTSN